MSAVSVKILLQNNDKKYLLQMRDNRPEAIYPLTWGLWGGAVEQEDDSALSAALREIEEELGLTLTAEDMIHQKTAPRTAVSEEVFFTYKHAISWGDFVVNEGAGAAFFTKEEMLLIPLAPSTKRAIEYGLIK